MFTLRHFVTASKGSTLKGSARKWMDRHINDPYVKKATIVRSQAPNISRKLTAAARLTNLLKSTTSSLSSRKACA